MVPDLGSSRGESTTSIIGFCPENVQERLDRGTQRATGLMVGYKVVNCTGKQVVEWRASYRLIMVINNYRPDGRHNFMFSC